MAPSLRPFIALMAIAALAQVAVGANHTIGAPTGSWDLSTDYNKWVKSRKFYTGDLLIFKYSPSHDVAEVSEADYSLCSPSEELSYDSSGNTVIELTAEGTRYFICAVPTHCTAGMKIQIDVLAKPKSPPTKASRAPTLPPAASPRPAKSPAPAPGEANAAAAAQHQHGVIGALLLGFIGVMFAMF